MSFRKTILRGSSAAEAVLNRIEQTNKQPLTPEGHFPPEGHLTPKAPYAKGPLRPKDIFRQRRFTPDRAPYTR